MNVQSGQVQQLTEGSEPAWSPNPPNCANNPPTGINLTITKMTDSRGNNVYTPNLSTQGTVEGNTVFATVQVDNCKNTSVQGSLQLMRTSGISDPLASQDNVTLLPFSSKEIQLSFSTKDQHMTWLNHNQGEYERVGSIAINAVWNISNIPSTSANVSFTVRPRPVMLVHGYDDTFSSWGTYQHDPNFLPLLQGVISYTVKMNTRGFPTNTIDQNAQLLRNEIRKAQNQQGADQVDVVAHSMGGLITRRYLAAYTTTPTINQVIMLGTPNLGVYSATLLSPLCTTFALGGFSDLIPHCHFPAILELTIPSVLLFNTTNTARRGAEFYDIVVWNQSVFGISLDGQWTYPSGLFGSCEYSGPLVKHR